MSKNLCSTVLSKSSTYQKVYRYDSVKIGALLREFWCFNKDKNTHVHNIPIPILSL